MAEATHRPLPSRSLGRPVDRERGPGLYERQRMAFVGEQGRLVIVVSRLNYRAVRVATTPVHGARPAQLLRVWRALAARPLQYKSNTLC